MPRYSKFLALASLVAGTLAIAAEPEGTSWAFRAPTRPPIPGVTRGSWARNSLDHFLLAHLERSHTEPAVEADRRTLLRRVTFDLLGLPPTPDEIEAFVGDPSPDAYEKRVDQLLASPRFGERWARHWLDVVRFAESNGFEMNQARPTAWPYRDWVIRAINEDYPQERFIAEQIAGDVLGADEATGFLVAGPWDQVKSPDPALTAQQRADELHDIVSTTGSAFLGLTVGCARCHDHKFDPVSMRDYYALTACFAGVQHGERPWRGRGSGENPEQLRLRLEEVTRALEALEPQALPTGSRRRLPVNARRNMEHFAATKARFVRFTILATNSAEPCLDELEVYSPGSSQNLALATRGAKATSSGDFAGAPKLHRLDHINDGHYGNPKSWISSEAGRGWVQIELPETVTIDRVVWGRDREGQYSDRLPTRYSLEVALEQGTWTRVASGEDRLPLGTAAPVAPPALEGTARSTYERLAGERTEVQRRLEEIRKGAMVYAGKFATPEPTFRLHRGDPLQKREAVSPGALSVIGPPLTLAATLDDPQRRLALARWIADPRHPLTARVLVNRLWHHHFGRGLVDTPSDFGRNGGSPTHPELLDWLACELQAAGGHLKPIHRLIVTSATYRQSSQKGNPSGPDSRFDHYPPRRLEAESLRDAILAVSGALDPRMGGPGFDLFEPNGNYVKVYSPKKEFGPAEFRRMVYQSKPRLRLDDTFGAFDCPDAGQPAARRTSSTTALQTLNLLNSRFIQQQSTLFAVRLERECGSDPGAQVRRAFLLAFGREPSEEEKRGAVTLREAHGLAALCRALLNSNEMLYLF